MIIKVNYTVSDVYMSTSISPVYIKVVYSGVSGGGGTWGTITGTLSNQTDLQTALDNKVPYTGATGPVNLGAYDLTVNSLTVGRGLGDNINNTVVGSQAGAAFTTAQTNVAIGEQALKVHSTGNANTAVGRYAMLSDVDGEFNTALGTSALVFLASGVNTGNTAIGVNGLGRLTSGSYNTWLGYTSAPNGILTSGSFNTIIGGQVNVGVATLNNNIIIADGQGNIRFRDDATSTILSRLAGTGTRMVISDANGALSTQAITSGTVTSVGLTMPNAFGVANSPITSNGTLAVTALGTASQYIRGDGELATLPTGGSGGSAVSYYLNGGTAASVGTYFQMSTTAVIGTNADFTRTGNGLVSQFLTDVGDPNRLQIPAGNWNFEMFFSMSSGGGTTGFYVELLKYDGTTFTSIASSSAIPETISSGTAIDLYLTSLAIPATTLLTTDRLALRVYIVNNSGGRTATLHTQDSHLCQIITNFAGGVSALNGLTANTQYFATGTSGTDFGISSVSDTHTFNIPTASATNRGALSSADWSTFNSKQAALTLTTTGTSGAATLVGATLNIPQYSGGGGGSMAIGGAITSATAGSVLFAGASGVLQQDNANLFWDDANNRLGIGTATPSATFHSVGSITASSALARGNYMQPTLVAGANNDVLVGLDINPTFTLGAFTGTTSLGLRVNHSTNSQIYTSGSVASNTFPFTIYWAKTTNVTMFFGAEQSANATIGNQGWTGTLTNHDFSIKTNDTGKLRVFAGGNVLIGTGATDAGYRLDVNGTARVSGSTTFGTLGTGTGMFWDNTNNRLGIGTATPTATLQVNNSVVGDNLLINGASSSSLLFNTDSFGRVAVSVSSNPSASAQAGAYFTANGHEEAWFNVVARAASIGNKYWRFGNRGASNTFAIQKLNDTATAVTFTALQISSDGIVQTNDSFNVSKNQNASTNIEINNTTSGTNSDCSFKANSNSGSFGQFGKFSTLRTTYKTLTGLDTYVYNNPVGGDISFLNDFGAGKIKFAAGASSTAQMTLTAAGRLLLGTTTESTFLLDVNGTARVSGDFTIADAKNIILAATTGTKIGTATSQKLSFWNATPIVQPTTGIAEAAFVENLGGSIVNVDSTFAGYTLQQIAQALKDMGALA